MRQKVAVLGAGSWGTALSMVLDENGHEVRLWGNDPQQIKEINEQHTNEHYLPGAKLSESIVAYTDLKAAIGDADALLFVLPTKAIRVVAKEVASLLDGQTRPHLIHASKGLEQDTHKRISVIIQEEIPTEKYDSLVVLSGPSHAEEVAKKRHHNDHCRIPGRRGCSLCAKTVHESLFQGLPEHGCHRS